MKELNIDKPQLSSFELVKNAIEKGIKFEIIDRDEAACFLREKNNYFRVESYRNNYEKYQSGLHKGKYINLDFAYLIDLSTIDMYLRNLIFKMCLDVEHHLKVSLLTDLSSNTLEDGYDIVRQFLENNPYIVDNIERKQKGTYCGDLIRHYFNFFTIFDSKSQTAHTDVQFRCPAWVLTEIIAFGDFIKFYGFYYETYPASENHIGLLNSIKSIRNACAHNNCVIYNLKKGNTKPNNRVLHWVQEIPGTMSGEIKSKLSNQPVYEFVCLLYLYNKIIPANVKSIRFKELRELFYGRILKHKDYYYDNQVISSTYKFILKIVDYLSCLGV